MTQEIFVWSKKLEMDKWIHEILAWILGFSKSYGLKNLTWTTGSMKSWPGSRSLPGFLLPDLMDDLMPKCDLWSIIDDQKSIKILGSKRARNPAVLVRVLHTTRSICPFPFHSSASRWMFGIASSGLCFCRNLRCSPLVQCHQQQINSIWSNANQSGTASTPRRCGTDGHPGGADRVRDHGRPGSRSAPTAPYWRSVV